MTILTVREQLLRQTISGLVEVYGAEKVLAAMSDTIDDHDAKELLRAAAAAEREAILASAQQPPRQSQ